MIALITGITVNIIHIGKTIAQKGAHVVKDGKRHKDVMLLLLGIPPKVFFALPWSYDSIVVLKDGEPKQVREEMGNSEEVYWSRYCMVLQVTFPKFEPKTSQLFHEFSRHQ